MRWRSYMNLFFLWLLCITNQFFHPGVHGEEGKFLENKSFIKFVRAIDPTNVLVTRWYGSMMEHCSGQWIGVKCDFKTCKIKEIRFENMNLSGVLDTDSLCRLQSLQVLDLAKNHIVGAIPDSILNCTSLTYLNLSSNLLQGELPSLHELKNLRSLDISKNNLSFSSSIQGFNSTYMLAEERSLQGYIPGIFSHIGNATEAPSPQVNHPRMEVPTFVKSWFAVIICIGFLSLFIYFMSKRAHKSVKRKENQQFLEHSIKISAVKAGEETKQGEQRTELAFFVEDHEMFQIEDLLESAADLQGQSLCSSLYKVRLKNNATYAYATSIHVNRHY